MKVSDLQSKLAEWPRLEYAVYPTPLEPLNNLTKLIDGPQLWIKRDDNLGHGFGGNKARKLEFLMADVLESGRKKVITYGGLQSNHTRMTAGACAALGIETHIFHFERRPSALQGNLLLSRLFGAKLHFIPIGAGGNGTMTFELTNHLVRLGSFLRLGPGAYFIPVGGHTVTGCLGYVKAAHEIHEQLVKFELNRQPVTVVTAAGTGGTLAGLMAGFAIIDSPVKVLGLDVGKLWRSFPATIARLASDLCQQLGETHRFSAADVPIIEGQYAGPGYAQRFDKATDATRLLAQNEGILLDPVYTGKAFAGLLDLINKGHFSAEEQLIFLHTGGYPSLWANGP